MKFILTLTLMGLLNGILHAQTGRDSQSAKIMGVPVDIENKKDRCTVNIGGKKPLSDDLKVPPDCFFAKSPADHNKNMLNKQSDDIQSLIVISLEKKEKGSCFGRLQCILATRDSTGVFVRPTIFTLQSFYKSCPSKQVDVLNLDDLWKLCHAERDSGFLVKAKKERLANLKAKEEWSLNYGEEIRRLTAEIGNAKNELKSR